MEENGLMYAADFVRIFCALQFIRKKKLAGCSIISSLFVVVFFNLFYATALEE